MIKKVITYTDFLGNSRTEEFLFNMNKAEVMKWLTTSGDYTIDRVLMRLRDERNGKEVIKLFNSLLKMSYGKISLDGRSFEKSDEIWNSFQSTNAYSELFMELIGDAKKAADFVTGILPADLGDEINKIIKEQPDALPIQIEDYKK